MSKSRFQKYWARIDNTPGTTETMTPAQIADVKRMVKAAFHAGHHEYRKRIEELEACCRHRDKQITTLHNFNNAKDKRIAELEEERYALIHQNCKDAHRIKELEAALDDICKRAASMRPNQPKETEHEA